MYCRMFINNYGKLTLKCSRYIIKNQRINPAVNNMKIENKKYLVS